MTVINPVDIETNIRTISDNIANGVLTCDKTYRAFLTADREYDTAFAKAYMRHTGPAHEKRYAAELATVREREARDDTDAAYRYADRKAKALQDELRAWQSVGASVRSMYSVAGVGAGR